MRLQLWLGGLALAVVTAMTARPAPADDTIKIGFITKFPVPFFATMEDAAKAYAAAHPGVEIIFGQGTSATDIEGQIESTEAHLNALKGQTTFYRITVSLEPISNPVVAAGNQFDPGGTLINAARAALVLGEFLATVLIWLVVFSVFLLPVLAIWLLVRRIRRTRPTRPVPPLPPALAPAQVASPAAVATHVGAPASVPTARPAGAPPAPPPGPSAG